MQVAYPSHHRWQRTVSDDPQKHFSPRTIGKINTALALFDQVGVTHTIAPLTQTFLDLFVPLYTNQIGSKSNAIVHDVYSNTLGKENPSFPYYCLSFFEGGAFIGGTIFSLRPNKISFAYRTFNNTWKNTELKITPAHVAEYLLAEFAVKMKLSFISHGKDRNPYGLNAAIGLAIFKLSVGCHATVAENMEIKSLDTDALTQDTLVLTMPEPGETLITKAILITSRENESKYLQVTKYPDQLTVEVLYRD